MRFNLLSEEVREIIPGFEMWVDQKDGKRQRRVGKEEKAFTWRIKIDQGRKCRRKRRVKGAGACLFRFLHMNNVNWSFLRYTVKQLEGKLLRRSHDGNTWAPAGQTSQGPRTTFKGLGKRIKATKTSIMDNYRNISQQNVKITRKTSKIKPSQCEAVNHPPRWIKDPKWNELFILLFPSLMEQ